MPLMWVSLFTFLVTFVVLLHRYHVFMRDTWSTRAEGFCAGIPDVSVRGGIGYFVSGLTYSLRLPLVGSFDLQSSHSCRTTPVASFAHSMAGHL